MTIPNLPLDVAQIVALFVESVFYGLHLASFGMCIYTLFVTRSTKPCHRVFFSVVAIILFTLATLNTALLLRHVLDAFVWYHGPGGPTAALSDISYWVNAMSTVTYVAQTIVGDAVLKYRCYMVYERSWKVIFPLCLLGNVGIIAGCFDIYIEFTTHVPALITTGELRPFVVVSLSITLALTLTTTAMIVYKIWSIQRCSREFFDGKSLQRAIRIIVDSGLMYSVGIVTYFVVYLLKNNVLYAISAYVMQIIGISFDLIIIRVEQGRTIDTEYIIHSDHCANLRCNRCIPLPVFNEPRTSVINTQGGAISALSVNDVQFDELDVTDIAHDLSGIPGQGDENSSVAP